MVRGWNFSFFFQNRRRRRRRGRIFMCFVKGSIHDEGGWVCLCQGSRNNWKKGEKKGRNSQRDQRRHLKGHIWETSGGEGGKACEYAIKSISRLLFSLALAAQDRIRFKRCQEEGEDGGKGLCHLPLFDVHFASASASDMMQLQQAKALWLCHRTHLIKDATGQSDQSIFERFFLQSSSSWRNRWQFHGKGEMPIH